MDVKYDLNTSITIKDITYQNKEHKLILAISIIHWCNGMGLHYGEDYIAYCADNVSELIVQFKDELLATQCKLSCID